MNKFVVILALLLFYPVNYVSAKILEQMDPNVGSWALELLDISVTICLMSCIMYFGFKYFKSQLDKKDEIIKAKDSEIKDLNRFINQDLHKIATNTSNVLSKIFKDDNYPG